MQGSAMRQTDLRPILSLPVNPDESWEFGVVPMAELFGLTPSRGQFGEEVALVLWRSSSTERCREGGWIDLRDPCRIHSTHRPKNFGPD
jgi:hypothetical protein